LFSASSFKSASIRGGPQHGTRNSEYRKQLHTSIHSFFLGFEKDRSNWIDDDWKAEKAIEADT
jgi:hypothetical protein